MHIPRRGEIAVYVAKQFDIPFGAEQRRIGRLKEGAAEFETANTLAKLLVRRINQLISPEDESSPADEVESKLPRFGYRMFFQEAAAGKPLEFLVKDGAKFFTHHAELAARTRELKKGKSTKPSIELEIYLYFFALPILANNLIKYSRGKKLLSLPDVSAKGGYWFLPDVRGGRKNCITPFANVLTWLRWRLGGRQHALQAFLCPDIEPESALREIERWRDGTFIPSAARIEEWANRFEGDRHEFRAIFHLGAAMTRAWRHMIETLGESRAIAVRAHLCALLKVLHEAGDRALRNRPNFEGQPAEIMRALRWLYSGPQDGPVTLGPNYTELTAEIHAAFIAERSPLAG